MKTVKKVISVVFGISMMILLCLPVLAAESEDTPYGVQANIHWLEPNYTNIATTFLTCGDTWISADVIAKSDMNLRIDVRVYKNGSLEDSFYATDYGTDCIFYQDYIFVTGERYKVEATYTAGSESTTKSVSFTQS